MTAPALAHRCTDCHRTVAEPLWMLGQPFGPKCGARYGLRLERVVRVRAPRVCEVGQRSLFDPEGDEINDNEE